MTALSAPLISDAELTNLGTAPGTLPGIAIEVRTAHALSASQEWVDALRPRFIVDGAVPNPYAKRLIAAIATYTLLQWRGFNPENDKEVAKGYERALAAFEQARNGKLSFGLPSRRRVFSGPPAVAETESGWLGWRSRWRRLIE
jgi:hypothetical protein